MPPKKQQLSAAELHSLIQRHGIRFEGSAPPKKWPNQHKHHFHAIRDINHIRYDDYKADRRIPKERKSDFKQRINFIREKSYGFLRDVGTNEATWRELEQYIFMRFDKRVICGNCSNELWKADFQANSLHVEVQADLIAKRTQRKMCCCKNRAVPKGTENNDEENCAIFDFAKQEVITHAPGDDLQNISLSMAPDRVIGLQAPSGMIRKDAYFPVRGRQILLPFLVVEAKREQDAPGFKAIQHQTAFPIRRFLKAQDDLFQGEPSSEPCLVWFFSYQGEQWRLHGCVLEESKIRIYDLWQGTIQSQDGALQLLLIVDYIWSWARDIYRPSVRKLLSDTTESSCDYSQASLDRFRRSISLSTATSSAPQNHCPDLMQMDRVMHIIKHPGGLPPSIGYRCEEIPEDDTTVAEEASGSSLRPTVMSEFPSSRPNFGSIQHANIVQFEFRFLDLWLPPNFESKYTDGQTHSIFKILLSLAFEIDQEQLRQLAALWILTVPETPALSPQVNVTLFYQTYCCQSTWQIKRVLNCVVWRDRLSTNADIGSLPAYVRNGSRQQFEMDELENAILTIQQVHGKDSVTHALQNVSLAFLPEKGGQDSSWISFDDAKISDAAAEVLAHLQSYTNHGSVLVGEVNLIHSLLNIDPPFQKRHDLTIRNLQKDIEDSDLMLAMQSSFRSAECSKFCLFITLEDHKDETNLAYQVLDKAIENRTLFNYSQLIVNRWDILDFDTLDKSDILTLFEWRRALKSKRKMTLGHAADTKSGQRTAGDCLE